jgi:dihydroxy-acid dehydratase/L-arabonate dehydrase
MAEHVKRGILEAGGFPVEFPVFSNGESNLRPTAMLTRNLASMDVEESIRGNPMDGVVLLDRLRQDHPGPADGRGQLRHAGHRRDRRPDAERQAPGPRHRFRHRCGSAEQVKAGEITMHDFMAAEAGMSRSAGTCNTMGTATMACMAESLGVSLPHNAAIPPWMRAAMCWRTCPACASSRWSGKA